MVAEERAPAHIFDLLEDAAATSPDNGMIYLEDGWDKQPTKLSHLELYQQVQTNAALLLRTGVIRKGEAAITYFDNARENVLWMWSIVAAGGVCAILNPVSTEPKTAAGQLENIKALFGEAPVLTSQKLASLFVPHGLNVKAVERLCRAKANCMSAVNLREATSPDDIAVLLFTSGSTGHSKAVKFSHRQLIASVQAKSSFHSSRGMAFMSWISFDHSACFCEIHLQALFNGSDQIFVPPSELVMEPRRFFQVLSLYRIGYTFSPNFFLAAAVESMEKRGEPANLDLSHLRVVMCGGEANRSKSLQATDDVLRRYGASKNTIKAAYGLSETCAACFYNLETPDYDVQGGKLFASAGKHLPGVMEMKIVPLGDDDSANPSEGLVYLRGALLFKGYYNNDEATQACMTEDGWMNTGDIGAVDKNGFIHLLGRQKEILILNGNNYSSFEIEHAIESSSIDGLTVSYTAVFSSWDEPRNSEGVVVLFNPSEAAIGPHNLRRTLQAIENRVVASCAQRPIVIPLPKTLLPKSTIGKLSRSKLKKAYEQGHFDEYRIDSEPPSQSPSNATLSLNDVSPLQQDIAHIVAKIAEVPPERLLESEGIAHSGISSLGFMRLKKALETGLKIHQEIPMPLLLRCHSIADLEKELTMLGTVSQTYDPIVPLATEGSKQTLFLLHPGSGEFLCWVNMVKFFPDRPVYALRAKGLHPGEGTFGSLEEVLTSYYNAIRRVQPNGPYALLGYCFGGLLSFELAKMFEATGEHVAFCGGIDNPPSLKRTIGQVQYRSLMIDVLPVVTDLTEEEALAFGAETSSLSDEDFYALLFNKFSPEFIENMDITVPRLQAFGRVEDSMRQIANIYEPTGCVSGTDIFCADPMPHFSATPEVWKRDVLGEWRGFVRDGEAKFHAVKGNHINLIKEPLINDFQEVLNGAMRERGI